MTRLTWISGCALALASIATPAHAGRDPYARSKAEISAFCRTDQACQRRQESEMAYFVTMVAAFPAARHAANHCRRHSKIGRHVIWTRATPCLRAAIAVRPRAKVNRSRR